MTLATADLLAAVLPHQSIGRINCVQGTTLHATLPGARIGDRAFVLRRREEDSIEYPPLVPLPCEVLAFNGNLVRLIALSDAQGIRAGDRIELSRVRPISFLRADCLGSILDSSGKVLDRQRESVIFNAKTFQYAFDSQPPPPLARPPIDTQFPTGIRAIDCLLPVGYGQRMVIFAEAGSGKSTLLGQICRSSAADVNIIALIGERSREVREFLSSSISPEILARSIVIVSTSDQSPIERIRAAHLASSYAEYFREIGARVLFTLDSLTRLIRAYRDLATARGESPARRGYPASVYQALPRFFERAGTSPNGSITAFYTMLTSSSLDEDPMVEEVQSLTDGHIFLSAKLASRAHYPAIDVPRSLSRLSEKLFDPQTRRLVADIQKKITSYNDAIERTHFGAPLDPEVSVKIDQMEEFLQQPSNSSFTLRESEECFARFTAEAL